MYFLTCPARNPWRVRSSRPPRLQSLHSPRPGGAQADPAHYPAHHCPAPCSGYRTWAAGRLNNNKKQLIRNSCPETADQKKLVRNSSSETAHQKWHLILSLFVLFLCFPSKTSFLLLILSEQSAFYFCLIWTCKTGIMT